MSRLTQLARREPQSRRKLENEMNRRQVKQYLETVQAEKGIQNSLTAGGTMFVVMVSRSDPGAHGIVILSTERARNIQLLMDAPATWKPLGVARYIAGARSLHVMPSAICTREQEAFLFEAIAKSLQEDPDLLAIRRHWEKYPKTDFTAIGADEQFKMRLSLA
jgi:hypothetical protein